MGYFFIFQNSAQRKQWPSERRFVQAGHPGNNVKLEAVTTKTKALKTAGQKMTKMPK
jgi:hypothetical protein